MWVGGYKSYGWKYESGKAAYQKRTKYDADYQAMELVASSKLRKAKERAETCRPYFTELHETLKDIARENIDFSSVYARESSNPRYCYVAIAGDRGLAGGYNANLFKCLEAAAEGKDYVVLPIGKKSSWVFQTERHWMPDR